MDKFQALRVFVEVAERRGFAAAARQLNMSPPAVTRYVSALEASLGTQLLVRTTRSLRLTESGERFLSDGRRILSELAEAEEAATGSHGTVSGELRVTAPVLFGRMFVAPVLGEFLATHPLVSARTLFVDRNVNLLDEGLDMAVRIGELPDSSLTAIRCGSVRQVIFASSAYLDQNGRPERPEDLRQHTLIQSVAVSEASKWQFLDSGKQLEVSVEPRARMNTNDAVVEMALAGHGISRLLSYQVVEHITSGRFERLLQDFEPAPLPVHILHMEGRRASSKVRAFVDLLAARLRAHAALNRSAFLSVTTAQPQQPT